MTTTPEQTPKKTPLEIQQAKVKAMRLAYAKEELELAERELEEAEAREKALQESRTLNKPKPKTRKKPASIVDTVSQDESYLDESELDTNDFSEDNSADGEEFAYVNDDDDNNYEQLYEEKMDMVSQKKVTSSSYGSSQPAPKAKVRSRNDERLIESYALPPHVSSWEITDNPEDPEMRMITFYADGEPATRVDINAENLEEMLDALNTEVLIVGNSDITGWSIRVPEGVELPPLFSLTSDGAIVATIPLDDDVLKKLVPALSKFYNPNKPNLMGLVNWANKHKFVAGFLVIFFTSLTAYSAWTMIF